MTALTTSIEKAFYAAIQWSLKHQLAAMTIVLLGIVLPIGTLNVLQYQSMVEYERQGTQAVRNQLHYLLGRLVVNSYYMFYQGQEGIFHALDMPRHADLLSGKPGAAQKMADRLQAEANKHLVLDKQKPRPALFIFAQEPNGQWKLNFARASFDSPQHRLAVREAMDHFFDLPPALQDTGHQYYYSRQTGRLVLLHTISPAPLRMEVDAPPRPITAVMGVTIDREMVGKFLEYQFSSGLQDKPLSRYEITPVDTNLAGATYFRVTDEQGRTVYQQKGFAANFAKADFIRDDLDITAEQRFLTGWRFSAITHSSLHEATVSALSQIFWASIVVAVAVGALLVVLFRAGLVAVKVAELQTDIVSGVSHDLKTPLAGIIASAQLLSTGRASGEQEVKQFSGYILSEAKRLTAVVEKVLTMAKLEARQLLMKPSAIAIPELVDHAITMSQAAFPHAIVARGEVATGQIYGDHSALTTVLMNLIDNAVRYSGDQEQPWVRVQAYWSGFGEKRVLHLMVEDRGVGIPAAEQPFIFQKFYRVRNGLVTDTEGTGLGLAIATQIVRAHRGDIQVESKVGSGSTFTINLPYEQPYPGR